MSKAPEGVELLDDFNKGLLYGTNPDSESYWGEIKSPYQETVELIPVNKFKLSTRNFYKHMAVNLLRKIKKQIK